MINRLDKLSILVVDDETDIGILYDRYLRKELGHHVDVVSSPGEATRLCETTLYDMVVCDAKMPYKGSPLGGVVLGQELSLRLGADSVLLISRVVDSVTVRTISTDLPFLHKSGSSRYEDWLQKALLPKIAALAKRQFGFVAMPFRNAELDSLYRHTIVGAAKRAGFGLLRVDEEAFTKAIVTRVFRLIRQAHFVLFVATGDNPNVYYEAGYAAALGKELVLCASTFADLPFDVRGDNCLAYHRQKRRFATRLEGLLGEMRFPRDIRQE
jgi:CheY-like chemotaxis protein